MSFFFLGLAPLAEKIMKPPEMGCDGRKKRRICVASGFGIALRSGKKRHEPVQIRVYGGDVRNAIVPFWQPLPFSIRFVQCKLQPAQFTTIDIQGLKLFHGSSQCSWNIDSSPWTTPRSAALLCILSDQVFFRP